MGLRDNWTKDASGNYVDWTKPPYRHPDSGILWLVLEHEDPEQVSQHELSRRIREYTALVRRNFKRKPPKTPAEHREHALATVRGLEVTEEPGAESKAPRDRRDLEAQHTE